MSRTMTSKCDGCGVEHVDDSDIAGMPPILGAGRRRGTDTWGSLSVATGSFPASFDLCDACTKRVVDLLELEIPKPEAVMKRLGGLSGLGGHAMYMPGDMLPGDFAGPPWMPPMKIPGLKANGDGSFSPTGPPPLVAPGVDMSTGTFTCPKCNSQRDCQSFNPICIACGYHDPDPKYG